MPRIHHCLLYRTWEFSPVSTLIIVMTLSYECLLSAVLFFSPYIKSPVHTAGYGLETPAMMDTLCFLLCQFRLDHSSTFESKWILSASELFPKSPPFQCCGIFHHDFRKKILTLVHTYLRCQKYNYHIYLSHSYLYDVSVLPPLIL